ncbi:hypothetical protein GCM10027443_22860 [Pontibacter brevis]
MQQLRQKDYSIRAIGRTLGITRYRANKIVKELELKQLQAPSTDAARIRAQSVLYALFVCAQTGKQPVLCLWQGGTEAKSQGFFPMEVEYYTGKTIAEFKKGVTKAARSAAYPGVYNFSARYKRLLEALRQEEQEHKELLAIIANS